MIAMRLHMTRSTLLASTTSKEIEEMVIIIKAMDRKRRR